MRFLLLAALFASACATARVRPADPVRLGSTRTQVVGTHGHPQQDGRALRDGHVVDHLVYANALDFLVVCLVDDAVVSWRREAMPARVPCDEYPRARQVASR